MPHAPTSSSDDSAIAEHALTTLLEAHRALRLTFEDRVREATGLSTAEADVLSSIGRVGAGRLRMVDIADEMMLSKSGVTQLVDRLVACGLLVRELSERDRRLVYAVLTARGQVIYERNVAVFASVAREYFAEVLTAKDLRTLTKLLTQVVVSTSDLR